MDPLSLFMVVFLSILSTAPATPVEPSCDDVHLTCTNLLHDTWNEEGFNILQEETLGKHCTDIIEDIACKKRYLSDCDPEGFKSFSLATDGVVEVLTEFCNETSELRKVYVQHSPCIANTSDAYQDCILNAAESITDSDVQPNGNDFYDDDETNDVDSTDAMIQRMCQFYEPFKDCVTRETHQSCGESAAQLIEDMIVRMAKTAVGAKCSNKT